MPRPGKQAEVGGLTSCPSCPRPRGGTGSDAMQITKEGWHLHIACLRCFKGPDVAEHSCPQPQATRQ